MTYNVLHDNADLPATVDAIARVDADVVLLQEVTARWAPALAALPYPHRLVHAHRRPAAGLAVLSKSPIDSCESYESPVGWFPAERLVIDGIQILHVHLRPAIDQGSWIRGYTTTPPFRLAEIEAYWRRLDLEMPTIIAGDFNETTFSGNVIQFLEDHHFTRVTTTGPQTWRYQDLLALDIDHVMTRGLAATAAQVLDIGTSDHRPVVATITR